MSRSLTLSKAYRTFLRLLTNTILSYTVIASLIAASFGVGRLFESYNSDKKLNSAYFEWVQIVESYNKEIYELRNDYNELRDINVELRNEIIELKQKDIKYEGKE